MLLQKEGGKQGHRMQCTAEHLVPRSQKGGHHRQNVVAACSRCNTARKDYPVETWVIRVHLRLKQADNLAHWPVLLKWLEDYGIRVASATPSLGPDGQNPLTVPPLKDAEPAP